ncbi:hypothetical protein [Azotobacter chroococcum]|uniref:hypothetical protein n=1 Tax=Azotobacter chroococcum TaxID=353 RepID=UPI003D343B32
MTRVRNPDGIPNALNVLYHSQRASAGLIVTAGTPISRRRRALCSSPASMPRRRSPAGRGELFRESRRLFGLSHATRADSSSCR